MSVVEESKSTFEPPTRGVHKAVCAEFIDLGMVPNTFEGKTRLNRQGIFIFLLDEKDSEGRPKKFWYRIWNMTLGKAPKWSKLRDFLFEWDGKAPGKSVDLAAYVGKGAELNLKFNPKSKDADNPSLMVASISDIPAPFSLNGYEKLPPEVIERIKEKAGVKPKDDDGFWGGSGGDDKSDVPF
jgi:hypothetical protein